MGPRGTTSVEQTDLGQTDNYTKKKDIRQFFDSCLFAVSTADAPAGGVSPGPEGRTGFSIFGNAENSRCTRRPTTVTPWSKLAFFVFVVGEDERWPKGREHTPPTPPVLDPPSLPSFSRLDPEIDTGQRTSIGPCDHMGAGPIMEGMNKATWSKWETSLEKAIS